MFDRKRSQGPEKSFPIDHFILDKQEFKFPERPDGATPSQLRPFYMKTGIVTQASGSAYIESGSQKIICAVYDYGPHQFSWSREVSDGILNCELRHLPMSGIKRLPYIQSEDDKFYSSFLRQALIPAVRLNLFPKSIIDVLINVIESDGLSSSISNAITCSSLALADAGIDMKDLVVGCSMGIFGEDMCIDLTRKEEMSQDGSLIIASMPQFESITNLYQTGEMCPEIVSDAIAFSTEVISQIHKIMVACLREK